MAPGRGKRADIFRVFRGETPHRGGKIVGDIHTATARFMIGSRYPLGGPTPPAEGRQAAAANNCQVLGLQRDSIPIEDAS